MTKSRTLRKAGAIALALALSVPVVNAAPDSAAAATKATKGTSKITLNKSKVTIYKGNKKTIKATLNKKQKKALKITLKSSKTSVAKVAKSATVKKNAKKTSFKITAKKKGTATVTASFKTSANKTKKAKVKVTVKKKTTPTEEPTEEPTETEAPAELALEKVESETVLTAAGDKTKYIRVYFNTKISSFDAGEVEIRDDKDNLLAVESVTLATDGKSARITMVGDESAGGSNTAFIQSCKPYTLKVTKNNKVAQKEFKIPVTISDKVVTAYDKENNKITIGGTARALGTTEIDGFDALGKTFTYKWDGSAITSLTYTDGEVVYGSFESKKAASSNDYTLTDVNDSTKTYKVNKKENGDAADVVFTLGAEAKKVTADTPVAVSATTYEYSKVVLDGDGAVKAIVVMPATDPVFVKKIEGNYITDIDDNMKSYKDYVVIKDHAIADFTVIASGDIVFPTTTASNKMIVVEPAPVEEPIGDVLGTRVVVGSKSYDYTSLNNKLYLDGKKQDTSDNAKAEKSFTTAKKGGNVKVYKDLDGKVAYMTGTKGEAATTDGIYILGTAVKAYALANSGYLQFTLLNGNETLSFTGTNGLPIAQLTGTVKVGGATSTLDPTAAVSNASDADAAAGNFLTVDSGGSDVNTALLPGTPVKVTFDSNKKVIGLEAYTTTYANYIGKLKASSTLKGGSNVAFGGGTDTVLSSASTVAYEITAKNADGTSNGANAIDKTDVISAVTVKSLGDYDTKTAATVNNSYVVYDNKTEAQFVIVDPNDATESASKVVSTEKVIFKSLDQAEGKSKYLNVIKVGSEDVTTYDKFDVTDPTQTIKGGATAIKNLTAGTILTLGFDASGRVVVSEIVSEAQAITVTSKSAAPGVITTDSGKYEKQSTTVVYKTTTDPTKNGYELYSFDSVVDNIAKFDGGKATFLSSVGTTHTVDVMIVEMSDAAGDAYQSAKTGLDKITSGLTPANTTLASPATVAGLAANSDIKDAFVTAIKALDATNLATLAASDITLTATAPAGSTALQNTTWTDVTFTVSATLNGYTKEVSGIKIKVKDDAD